jgi:DNA helicase HerA-like ATPase
MDALSQELEKVSDSNYVNNLYSKYKTQLDSMSSGLEKEFDKELILTINNLKENQKKLKKVINTINQ